MKVIVTLLALNLLSLSVFAANTCSTALLASKEVTYKKPSVLYKEKMIYQDSEFQKFRTELGLFVPKTTGGKELIYGLGHVVSPIEERRSFPYLFTGETRWSLFPSKFIQAIKIKIGHNIRDYHSNYQLNLNYEVVYKGQRTMGTMQAYDLPVYQSRPDLETLMKLEIRSLGPMYDFITASMSPAELQKIAEGGFGISKMDQEIAKSALNGRRYFAIQNAFYSALQAGYDIHDLAIGEKTYEREFGK